jgi:hypothetical protein
LSSAGLHDAIRIQGLPDAASAGKATTLSSTMASGVSSSIIAASRSSTYFAPSIRALQVGAMNSSSWTIVGFRKTGAVSRMKSIQNCPGISSTSGLGPRRIRRSSKPFASNVPANDSSTTNTTRWPRARSTWPIPTQLLVGPKAPSGKKTIVCASLTPGSWRTQPLLRSVALQDGTKALVLELVDLAAGQPGPQRIERRVARRGRRRHESMQGPCDDDDQDVEQERDQDERYQREEGREQLADV